MLINDQLEIIWTRDISLTPEAWQALHDCADSISKTVPELLQSIAGKPDMLEKISIGLRSRTIGYGDIFSTPVVRPVEPVTETLSLIQIDGDEIRARMKNEVWEVWIELVKNLDYYWDSPFWRRDIKSINGSVLDRAAELGFCLLKAGFCVIFPNPEVRDLAIGRNFAREQKRWVMRRTSGKFKDYFALRWGRSDDCYDDALKITGSRYSKPHVVVPPEHFEEVLDFAEMFKFEFTESALKLVEKCREWRSQAMVVSFDDLLDPNADSSGPGPGDAETNDDFEDEVGIPDALLDEPL